MGVLDPPQTPSFRTLPAHSHIGRPLRCGPSTSLGAVHTISCFSVARMSPDAARYILCRYTYVVCHLTQPGTSCVVTRMSYVTRRSQVHLVSLHVCRMSPDAARYILCRYTYVVCHPTQPGTSCVVIRMSYVTRRSQVHRDVD